MSRHFHFVVEQDDEIVRDDEVGTELPDLEAAFRHAGEISRRLSSEWVVGGQGLSRWAAVRILSEVGEGLGPGSAEPGG